MIHTCSVNGQFIPVAEAGLGLNDLSILRGYGLFDYFLARNFQPFFFEDYLERFFRSAEQLHLTPPLDQIALRDHVLELLQRNEQFEAGVRLVLTGGYAEDSFTPVDPNLIILQHPMPKPPRVHYTQGIRLMLHHYERHLPKVKSIGYLEGIRMMPVVRQRELDDILYHWGGNISESVRSNFFVFKKDGTLVTSNSGILFGITRKKVIELAGKRCKVEIRPLRLEELQEAEEAFLTSSIKGVMPVISVEDQIIGNGKPGPLTQQLYADYRQLVDQYLATQLAVS